MIASPARVDPRVAPIEASGSRLFPVQRAVDPFGRHTRWTPHRMPSGSRVAAPSLRMHGN